jgi:RNA polymerase sigma factor (sigma-70 family)
MIERMSQTFTSESTRGLFPRTHWSVVRAACCQEPTAESQAALEALCRAYWRPLFAFARHRGYSAEDAQDMTQAFFARLLEKRWFGAADPARGRLRTFLIAAFKHFLSNEWRRESALKRGGGQWTLPLDTALAESLSRPTDATAEEVFDRQWALRLLELALSRLQGEFLAADKAAEFEVLKDCLMAAHGDIDYAGLAQKLGMQPGAVRVAAHRLRKRFRQVYREELARTLEDKADLEEELRYLASVLAAEPR